VDSKNFKELLTNLKAQNFSQLNSKTKKQKTKKQKKNTKKTQMTFRPLT
jgi:hypothetical protein